MSTLRRIKEYIDYKGINNKQFEESVGFSNGSFSSQLKNNRTIGVDKLENILSIYPDINPTWLLTGEGGMLKDGINTSITGKGNTVRTYSNILNNSSGTAMIGENSNFSESKSQRNELEVLQKKNEEYLKEIEYLKRTLADKESSLVDKERLIQVLMNNLTNKK